MTVLVWIVGWLAFFEGILFLVRPDFLKPVLQFFRKGKRLYLVSLVRIILAVIFFLAAQQCRIPWVIILFGVIMLISGILGFVMKLETAKDMLSWWEEKSPTTIRIIGLIALAIGAIIIYSA